MADRATWWEGQHGGWGTSVGGVWCSIQGVTHNRSSVLKTTVASA